MKLFNFKRKESPQEPLKDSRTGPDIERISVFHNSYDLDKSNWFQVFSACLGKMIAIQNACHEIVVKNRDWNVDFSKGTIAFGDDIYPLQFLGSESASSNTWLWGWENVNGFDEKLLGTAEQARQLGSQWKLEPLTEAQFELTDMFNGHALSIVACGISNQNLCYYRCPHSGGAAFTVLSNIPDKVFAPIDALNFTSLTSQCISQYYVDHKIFVESLLLWNGTAYDWKGDSIMAHFSQDLIIEFEKIEDFLRIKNMKTL